MASNLENKYQIIRESFGDNVIFTVHDVLNILADMSKSSVYWILSNLVTNGYLLRVGKGKYSLNFNKTEKAPIISSIASKVLKILEETSFDYYISGIDVLSRYLHHIPENYPVMLFVNKFSQSEVIDILTFSKIAAVVSKNISKDFLLKLNTLQDIVVIYPTESFSYANNHIATIEKAFIDLYFEISRNQFPFAIQELARVYDNMYQKGVIDKSILIKTAYVRNIQSEIRFMVEGKNMPKDVFIFVDALREVNNNG